MTSFVLKMAKQKIDQLTVSYDKDADVLDAMLFLVELPQGSLQFLPARMPYTR